MKKLFSILAVICVLTAILAGSIAEDVCFIICKPGTYVCVRRSANKRAMETGMLDCGDSVITDRKTKNGYLHILGITEDGEGWVFAGYVVEDQPVIEEVWATVAATGRVAARRWVSGKFRCWVNVCTDVKVYARSEEWSITSKGFMQTKYLEVWR